MNHISYEGFNSQCMTFIAGEGAAAGQPAALNANGEIINAASGAKVLGVICNVRNGICAVQLEGYTTLAYTGTAPALGYTALSANGSGGVKADNAGAVHRVIQVDTDNKTVGIIL